MQGNIKDSLLSTFSHLLQQATDAEAVQAIEENLIAFITYCSCVPGAQTSHNADHIAALTGIPQPSLNVIMRTRMCTQHISERIAAAMAPFKERQMPMLWWIFPDTQPTDLGFYLKQNNLHFNGTEPGMVLELSQLPATLSLAENFCVEEVESQDALEEWIQVSSNAFGGEAVTLDSDYGRFEQCLGWGQHLPYRRFLGRLNGEAVATSSLFMGAGVAGLYSVGTLPQARGQGIGSAISLAPLLVARSLGYNISILQSSPAGYSIYRKIGFHECCQLQTYLWAPDDV
jgi:GNAT superfamily N-acetyltransferase